MRGSSRNAAAVAVFLAAIAVVICVTYFSRDPVAVFQSAAIPAGWILIAVGSALDVWAILCIRRGVAGRIDPLLACIVRNGPYQYIRHPVYLGMLMILAGVALRLGSWPGVAAVVLVFLPSVILRAHLEETALQKRFGSAWNDYRLQTGFLLPRIHRGKP